MGVKKISRGVLPQKHRHADVVKTIYIAPKTPFAGALSRVDKALARGSNSKRVRVVGMGRAIQTVLQLAAGLMERKYSVVVNTLTLKAVDERIDEKRGTAVIERRSVPAVELLVAANLPH